MVANFRKLEGDSRTGRSFPERFHTMSEKDEPGRNDPCSCGSGKKYKHCCIEKPDSHENLWIVPTVGTLFTVALLLGVRHLFF